MSSAATAKKAVSSDDDESLICHEDPNKLRALILSFRMMELQALLNFAGKSKVGRKTALQDRAISLLEIRSVDISLKIHELSNFMYKSLNSAPSVNPYSANYQRSVPRKQSQPPQPTQQATKMMSKTSRSKKRSRKPSSGSSSLGDSASEIDDDDDENFDTVSSTSTTSSSLSYSSVHGAARKRKSKHPRKKVAPVAQARSSMSRDEPMVTSVAASTGRARRRAAMVAFANITDHSKEVEREQDKEIIRHEREGREKGAVGKTNRETNPDPPYRPAMDGDWRTKTLNSATVAEDLSIAQKTNATTTNTAQATAPVVTYSSTFTPGYRSMISAASSISRNTSDWPHASSIPAATRSIFAPSSEIESTACTIAASAKHTTNGRTVQPASAELRLKKLPFYKNLATLLKPTRLESTGSSRFQKQSLSFVLSTNQAEEILDTGHGNANDSIAYERQIQLRFCPYDTSCEQTDTFPALANVKVNHKVQPLPNPVLTNKPGVDPKRPPRPVDITNLCNLSGSFANHLNISWSSEFNKPYAVSVYLVEKLTTRDLMKSLQDRGTRCANYTRALIKEKLNDVDNDISTTSCKVTLACPLGKMRMTYPCRADTCDHLQCFDANLYIMMNERKPKWLCPVCNKPALYDNLLIDGYFTDIIASKRLPADEHEIVLHNDGTWEPIPSQKTGEASQGEDKPKLKAESNAAERVDDAEPAVNVGSPSDDYSRNGGKSKLENDVNFHTEKRPIDCITLDSDSEDEVEKEAAPSKRSRLNNQEFESPTEGEVIYIDD